MARARYIGAGINYPCWILLLRRAGVGIGLSFAPVYLYLRDFFGGGEFLLSDPEIADICVWV